MRLVVEALGGRFGGIRTYLDHLLAAWPEARPGDELLVLTDPDHGLATGPYRAIGLDARRPDLLTRPFLQTAATRRLVRDFAPDAVLAAHPATSLLRLGVPHGVVVHDLRHELQPEQFSGTRRLVRKVSYGRAYEVATGFIAISDRTRRDLLDLHPRLATKPIQVVHHGADHALAWPGEPRSGAAVTFGHHPNKNAELVVEGWAAARRAGVEVPGLTILGAASRAAEFVERAEHGGVADVVRVAGWLPDEEYAAVVGSASMVVMASNFEGFGLPVVEAMVRGIPVICGPDPAMLEVGGGHVVQMADWTPAALADAIGRALALTPAEVEAGRQHAAGFTWARTVESTAAALQTF